jgi:hypothetical protein
MIETTKEDIEAMERHIAHRCKIADKIDADIRDKCNRLEQMQKNCKHDFEFVPVQGANIVECKICGYMDGV